MTMGYVHFGKYKKRQPRRLTKLAISEVSTVDKASNPHAQIVFTKREEPEMRITDEMIIQKINRGEPRYYDTAGNLIRDDFAKYQQWFNEQTKTAAGLAEISKAVAQHRENLIRRSAVGDGHLAKRSHDQALTPPPKSDTGARPGEERRSVEQTDEDGMDIYSAASQLQKENPRKYRNLNMALEAVHRHRTGVGGGDWPVGKIRRAASSPGP